MQDGSPELGGSMSKRKRIVLPSYEWAKSDHENQGHSRKMVTRFLLRNALEEAAFQFRIKWKEMCG